MYEFYIAQSIFEETANANLEALSEETTLLSTTYLAIDLDIVRMVAEEVMERPVE